MRIQFSSKSKNINFAINNEKGAKENSTYDNYENETKRGKVFITFKKPNREFIYLNVFLNQNEENIDSKLNNYVFKYMNSISREYFFEYPVSNNDSIIVNNMAETQNGNNIEIKFNRINKNNLDITYSLKIKNELEISDEEIVNSIAISEDQSVVSNVHNPTGDIITVNVNGVKEYSYIAVIAQIKEGPIIEYVAYKPYTFK
jgi:hypothetical protein